MRALIIGLLLFGISTANATVIKTLDGVTYEWLEITETPILSRSDTELLLQDENSSLYGYEYASRALVEKLLLSYSSWNGIGGLHQDLDVVAGGEQFFSDFGYLESSLPTLPVTGPGRSVATSDGDGSVTHYGNLRVSAFYGLTDECGIDETCVAQLSIYVGSSGEFVALEQGMNSGWDASTGATNFFDRENDSARINTGSFLVRTSVVPIPAAAWLFGSALAGLGWMRRKQIV